MMAGKFVDREEIQNYLECSVCLNVLDDPRNLNCNHTLCCTCIDDVITFNEDGSTEIICPTCRCSTTLPSSLTTKDLPKPYVIFKLLEDIKNEQKPVIVVKKNPKTIDIGSCSLHVLHGAFKSGDESTDWSLNKIIKAMWRIFDDSPARRDIYKICEVVEFPLRFCTTRWIEDENVVKHAIKLWPNIIKVINNWLSLCKSKRSKNNKPYETLVGHHLDEALPVKMQFFQDVASELKSFLQLFQTNNPMVHFLEKALVDVLHTLLQMVVKLDVLDQANSSFELTKLDLTNSENLLPCELMKLPTATKLIDSCKGTNDCKSEITQWCTQCRKKFCKDCFAQHGCANKVSVEGHIHVYSNTFRMTCKRHNALIIKICKTCNSQHLCIYCTNLEHKEHDTLTLPAFTNELKNQYLEKLKQTKRNYHLNNFSYLDALEEAHEYKQELTIELDTRIIRKVIKYIEHLNNQKHSIILQYENIVKEWEQHLEQLGLLQDNFVNVITNAIQEVQDMEIFRVIVDKVANTNKIHNLTTPQFLNVSLTKETPQGIGRLSGITFRGNSVSNPVLTDKLFKATEIQINKEECEKMVHLIKNLTNELEEFSSRVEINLYRKTDILNLITNNNFEEVRRIYLLDPNQLNDGEFIYSSAEHNKPKILKILLKVQNSDIHFVTERKHASLHLACEKGYKSIVELLIRNKARVDEKDSDGCTPLHGASSRGHKEIVELLIRYNARVDEKDNYGWTPLHVASLKGGKEIVENLIRNKARVDAKDKYGQTPLHLASWEGHEEIVELLIRNKARVDGKDNDGCTPLHGTSSRGHKEIVELLIRYNARVDEKDNYGWTPLHVASLKGRKEIVEFLIRNKARVDAKDKYGQTPLHLASWEGHEEIVELLIRNKARVDGKDNDGCTPLHGASSRGHKDIVELLKVYSKNS